MTIPKKAIPKRTNHKKAILESINLENDNFEKTKSENGDSRKDHLIKTNPEQDRSTQEQIGNNLSEK